MFGPAAPAVEPQNGRIQQKPDHRAGWNLQYNWPLNNRPLSLSRTYSESPFRNFHRRWNLYIPYNGLSWKFSWSSLGSWQCTKYNNSKCLSRCQRRVSTVDHASIECDVIQQGIFSEPLWCQPWKRKKIVPGETGDCLSAEKTESL